MNVYLIDTYNVKVLIAYFDKHVHYQISIFC
jgi:hypothetical protein